MASKHEDGMKLLELFRTAWKAQGDLYDACGEMYKEASEKGKEQHAKQLHSIGLLTQLKVLHSVMEEIHHTIGHGWFNDCWTMTEVGQEFAEQSINDSLKQLFGDEKIEVQMLDPNNLPDSMPDELKKVIKDHYAAHERASRAHLH